MDQDLRVTITADASGLSAGLAEATDQVQTAATSMASAQEKATLAAKNLADAQNQLGAAAAAGNAAAAAIIQEYAAANAAATAAVEDLTGAVAAETPVMAASATATRAASTATRTITTDFYAAQGASALLNDRIPYRAMERFLASLPGVSAGLRAAFPIIGAIAMAEVLGEMVKHAYDLYEKFISIDAVSQKLIEDFQKMQQTDFINVHDLETANERLAQANVQATNLNNIAQQMHGASFKDLFGDLFTANAGQIGLDVAGLVGARKLAEQGALDQKQSIELTLKQIELEHELALQKIETAHAGDSALTDEQRINAELEKRLAIDKEDQLYERRRERALGNPAPADADAQMTKLKDEAAEAEASAQRRQLDYKEGPGLYFAELFDDLRKSTSQLNESSKAIQESWGASLSLQLRDQSEAYKNEIENDQRAAEQFKRNREFQVEAAREAAAAQIDEANDAFAAAELQIGEQEQLGRVTKEVADQQLLDAAKLKEQSTMGALQKEQGLFNPALGQKELQEYTQLQDRITSEARKAALERERIEQQEQQRFIQKWRQVTNEFNSDFQRAFNEWATRSETAGKAWGRMLGSMEEQLMDYVAKFILEKAEMWAMDEALQLAGVTKQHAVAAASNVATVTGDAGVAAAGTMAYYSATDAPAALAMAEAAFAETMTFAAPGSYAVGGVVPGFNSAPVRATVHAGERVLTAAQNSTFESLVNNGGNSSRNSLHYAPTFNGGGMTHEEAAAQATKMIRQMVRPEARQ